MKVAYQSPTHIIKNQVFHGYKYSDGKVMMLNKGIQTIPILTDKLIVDVGCVNGDISIISPLYIRDDILPGNYVESSKDKLLGADASSKDVTATGNYISYTNKDHYVCRDGIFVITNKNQKYTITYNKGLPVKANIALKDKTINILYDDLGYKTRVDIDDMQYLFNGPLLISNNDKSGFPNVTNNFTNLGELWPKLYPLINSPQIKQLLKEMLDYFFIYNRQEELKSNTDEWKTWYLGDRKTLEDITSLDEPWLKYPLAMM